tara:strand:- start:59 stop:754 length:696 start_codon:yes stop_codon:yes gene_type:complete
MKAYCITVVSDDVSKKAYERLVKSSKHVSNDFEIHMHAASTPKWVRQHMKFLNLEWTYPWEGERIDLKSGLTLKSYPTKVREKRIACFLSHYQLWENVIQNDEPILVLEHDAMFHKKLEPEYILESDYDIIGINDPRGATRKSKEYYDKVTSNVQPIIPVPRIDNFNVPQGLAGNSAYIIKPNGAKQLIEATKKYGAWPNDALMCYQIIEKLGVTNKFYTRVQGLRSTTTL